MKHSFFTALIAASTFVSCSHGLNKPIIEPLTVDELRANMKNEDFSDFYSDAQEISEWILKDDMKQAKYGTITYKDLMKYQEFDKDTTYFKKKYEAWRADYAKIYPSHDTQVDSITNYWKSYKERYSMDSLVKIEFDELWKEYYSYSHDVRDVNIGFKVTPLKGTIEQLIFRYEMVSKVNNTGKIGYLNGHRCLASSPISKAKTLYWEASYSDEKALKNMSSAEVKRDYDFLIEVVNVRMNGENYEDKLDAIPQTIKFYLEEAAKEDSFMIDYYRDKIIKEYLDPEYKSESDYITEQKVNELERKYPEVTRLYKEYYNYDELFKD